MFESLNKIIGGFLVQFRVFFKTLSPLKKNSIIASGVVLFLTLVMIVIIIPNQKYGILFSNVSSNQLSIIINELNANKVPYKIKENGQTVLVPEDLLRSTQMSVMTKLSESNAGSDGLEIFAKQDFGTTSYAQRVNFQRALQGELMRAINTVRSVKKSKVILALPPKKTFLEEGGKASASVVLELFPGKKLSPEQVKGISYMVSNSVEGLSSENVTVIDSRGNIISKNYGSDSAVSNGLMDIKKKVEGRLESKIQSMLERVVGSGNIVAKVDALVNNQATQTVQELVDADGIALQSQTTEEELLNGARNTPNGIPGVKSNIPDEARGPASATNPGYTQNVSKNLKTDNYAVPKTTKQIQEAAGRLERVSVSVLVDHKKVMKEVDGEMVEEIVARSPEEIKQYENIIKNAVGFNAKRGDTISVENIKFQHEDFSKADQLFSSMERKHFVQATFKWTVLLISLLLFFFFALRPFMKWLTDSFNETVEEMLPRTIEELEELQAMEDGLPGMGGAIPSLEKSLDPEKAETELLKEKIIDLFTRDEEKGVSAVNEWLKRRD